MGYWVVGIRIILRQCNPHNPELIGLFYNISACLSDARSISSIFLTSSDPTMPAFSQDFIHSTAQITWSHKQFQRSEISSFGLLNTLSTTLDMEGIEWMEGAILAIWDQRGVFRRACQKAMRSGISSLAGESWNWWSWSVFLLKLFCHACVCFHSGREALDNEDDGSATKTVHAVLQ